MSLEQLTLSDEQVQDTVASLITSGDNADAVYDDVNDTLTVSLSDSISVNTLEATTSITDPEGNTVTNLSEPVRVTEEASTFTESNVTVTNNATTVKSGSIQLGFDAGTTATRGADNKSQSETDGRGLEISPNTNIDGVRVTVSGSTGTFQDAFIVDSTETFLSEKTGGFSAGDVVDFETPLDSGETYYVGAFDNGNSYQVGVESLPSFPQTSADIDITNGAFGIHPNDGLGISPTSGDAFVFRDVTALTTSNNGNALVELGNGAPTDIESYDLATFQRTLDSETATVDVEDSNGTVLKSDISKDTDISDIPTSTDVQLRANLSRNNTSNNPTIDYLARRFTR